MPKKKISEFNHNIVPTDDSDGSLNLFDLNNPDINLFNAIDDELIKVSGSKILIYTYEHDDNYDDLFDERRSKAINPFPKVVWGHYDPRALEENLTEFGIEITNDQIFTFNKAYLEHALSRPLRAGDIVKPAFQNIFYEVFEVQEDNFAAYGVYHLLASAKVLREAPEVFPEGHAPEVPVMPNLRSYIPYEASEGYRIKVEEKDGWSDAQKDWIKANVRSILFTRDCTKERRDEFGPLELEHGRRGIYTCFTTIMDWEREQYGAGIDQFLAVDSNGEYYPTGLTGAGTQGPVGEYVAKFWDEYWLEARWNLIPGTREDPTLKDSGLDYVFMDLCNLYPVEYYIGDSNNPLDTSGAWREAMVNTVRWVREKLDGSIGLIANGVRHHVGAILGEGGYIQDPSTFFNIDGTDLVSPELANAGVIEASIGWDDASPPIQIWQYTLRTILRCAQENKAVYSSWHTDTGAIGGALGEKQMQHRMNNWVSHSLVHLDGLTEFSNMKKNDPSPFPAPLFPENAVDLGQALQSPHSFFETKDTTEEKIFTREFTSGYVAIFNFTFGIIDVPSRYSSYKKVVLNDDIILNTDGTTNGTIAFADQGVERIDAFDGIMLKRP